MKTRYLEDMYMLSSLYNDEEEHIFNPHHFASLDKAYWKSN